MRAEHMHPSNLVIPAQEFQQYSGPVNALYIFGKSPDRSTFTPFVIESFGVSMGSPIIQALYFEYLRNRTGFDSNASFGNYFSAGGAVSLRDEEKERILSAIRGVEGHRAGLKVAEPESALKSLDENIRKTLKENTLETLHETIDYSKFMKYSPKLFLTRLHGAAVRERKERANRFWELY